jgi:1,4-dihydroxy-2-naphthoate polyprenyltransferase
MVKNFTRALRLPFITASILPFTFGSLIHRKDFNFLGFLFGLAAACSTHLSANLINDYADSKSGADWQDKRFYGFFGGSKLIQENALSEKFYLRASIFFALIALLSVMLLAIVLKSALVIILFTIIISLGWSYSMKPLRFSYRYMGELIIFLMFGPALVMGGYFIQTGIFPDSKSFLLSLPFGLLVSAILFSNEIPDCDSDTAASKFTLVKLFGKAKAFIGYYLLMLSVFFSIALNVAKGYLNISALFSFVLIGLVVKSARIMRNYPADKLKLVESSKTTINIQLTAGIVLIISLFI